MGPREPISIDPSPLQQTTVTAVFSIVDPHRVIGGESLLGMAAWPQECLRFAWINIIANRCTVAALMAFTLLTAVAVIA
jgi:hypothetical protein